MGWDVEESTGALTRLKTSGIEELDGYSRSFADPRAPTTVTTFMPRNFLRCKIYAVARLQGEYIEHVQRV